uniref:Cytidyltransferase-like domain-containing protein n=1 Tax=Parascaris univalens TaxID=6257 RepID=A0A914ZW79_PARUN
MELTLLFLCEFFLLTDASISTSICDHHFDGHHGIDEVHESCNTFCKTRVRCLCFISMRSFHSNDFNNRNISYR